MPVFIHLLALLLLSVPAFGSSLPIGGAHIFLRRDTVYFLIVEDNPGDARLLIGALDEQGCHSCRLLRDGEEAVEYLSRVGLSDYYPRPDLVFLDLNMPKKDGFEVLQFIRATPDLNGIPILILSTSRAEQDIQRSLALNATSYISKPAELEQYDELVKIGVLYARRAAETFNSCTRLGCLNRS